MGLTDPCYPRLPQSTVVDASAATLGNARWCGGAQAIVLAVLVPVGRVARVNLFL